MLKYLNDLMIRVGWLSNWHKFRDKDVLGAETSFSRWVALLYFFGEWTTVLPYLVKVLFIYMWPYLCDWLAYLVLMAYCAYLFEKRCIKGVFKIRCMAHVIVAFSLETCYYQCWCLVGRDGVALRVCLSPPRMWNVVTAELHSFHGWPPNAPGDSYAMEGISRSTDSESMWLLCYAMLIFIYTCISWNTILLPFT